MRIKTAIVIAAGIGIPAAAAAQGAPSELKDLVGARAAGAETQMEARGYEYVDTRTVRNQKWTYWRKRQNRTCVQVATMDGRYSSINTVPASNCDTGSGRSGNDHRPEGGNSGGGYHPPVATHLPSMPPREYQGNDYYYDPNVRDSDTLTLICWGNGEKSAVRSGTDYMWNPRRHRYEPRSYIESGREGFSSGVQVELWPGGGRIHLTGKLIPPVHSGGKNDWWDLYDVVRTRDTITGKYKVNGLNKPKLTIDRRTGYLSIKGLAAFEGRCDVGNWGDGRNRF